MEGSTSSATFGSNSKDSVGVELGGRVRPARSEEPARPCRLRRRGPAARTARGGAAGRRWGAASGSDRRSRAKASTPIGRPPTRAARSRRRPRARAKDAVVLAQLLGPAEHRVRLEGAAQLLPRLRRRRLRAGVAPHLAHLVVQVGLAQAPNLEVKIEIPAATSSTSASPAAAAENSTTLGMLSSFLRGGGGLMSSMGGRTPRQRRRRRPAVGRRRRDAAPSASASAAPRCGAQVVGECVATLGAARLVPRSVKSLTGRAARRAR